MLTGLATQTNNNQSINQSRDEQSLKSGKLQLMVSLKATKTRAGIVGYTRHEKSIHCTATRNELAQLV